MNTQPHRLLRQASTLALIALTLVLGACSSPKDSQGSQGTPPSATATPQTSKTASEAAAPAAPRSSPYAKPVSVWPAGMLDNPAIAARIPSAGQLPTVAKASVEQITIGMTPEQVTRQLGTAAATDDKHQRWQYIVKDDKGLFAVTLWFNTDERIWMANTSEPFAGVIPAPAPVQAAPAAPVVLKTWNLSSQLLFGFDSDKLKTGSAELQAVTREIAQYPQAHIQLQAHSDRLGSADYNLRLSQRRAAAIRQYLISQGIAAQTITSEGLGAQHPVVDCAASLPRQQLIDCLALNRRVVITAKNP